MFMGSVPDDHEYDRSEVNLCRENKLKDATFLDRHWSGTAAEVADHVRKQGDWRTEKCPDESVLSPSNRRDHSFGAALLPSLQTTATVNICRHNPVGSPDMKSVNGASQMQGPDRG
jgi:hypothetical protein